MKPRNAEAAWLETDYVTRVKAALASREASEVDEVIQSVKEHIEEELSDDLDGEVSLVQMANVLERLGPPEAYIQPEGDEAPPTTSPSPRLSTKAVLGALMVPITIALAFFILAIGEASGVSEARLEPLHGVVVLTGFVAAVLLSASAFGDIRRSDGRLRGRVLALVGLVLPPALVVLGAVKYVMLRNI